MYNFALKVSDFTGSLLVQCLGETGDAFLGMRADQFYGVKDDLEQVRDIAQQALMQQTHSIVIRAKPDTGGYSQGDEGPRMRYTVVRSAPYEVKQDNQSLVKRLQIYSKKPELIS